MSAERELSRVIAQVMLETGITADEIRSGARQKLVTQARHRAMALLREREWTLTQIASALGCDKQAVRYALSKATGTVQ